MRSTAILYPVLVQVALTFILLFAMAQARLGAIRRKEVKVGAIALGQDAWPPVPSKRAASFHNQFEMPVLFYALVGLALASGMVTTRLIYLAWAFVALRVVHAVIHTGSNNVRRRFMVFLVGVLVLIVMWVDFAIGLALRA